VFFRRSVFSLSQCIARDQRASDYRPFWSIRSILIYSIHEVHLPTDERSGFFHSRPPRVRTVESQRCNESSEKNRREKSIVRAIRCATIAGMSRRESRLNVAGGNGTATPIIASLSNENWCSECPSDEHGYVSHPPNRDFNARCVIRSQGRNDDDNCDLSASPSYAPRVLSEIPTPSEIRNAESKRSECSTFDVRWKALGLWNASLVTWAISCDRCDQLTIEDRRAEGNVSLSPLIRCE